jgi:hypothetical protein
MIPKFASKTAVEEGALVLLPSSLVLELQKNWVVNTHSKCTGVVNIHSQCTRWVVVVVANKGGGGNSNRIGFWVVNTVLVV